MVLGLLALAGSTLLLCLGKSIGLLVIGRLLQGISASVVWSVGLALLADTVGREIGKYLGYTSVALSCGLLISPTIGGVVYERAGYYAVYYVAFGVIFLDIVLRLLLIEKKVAKQWTESSDEPGAQEVIPTSEAREEGTKDGGLRLLKSPDSTAPAAAGQAQPPSGASDSAAAGDMRKRRNPNLILICDSRVLAALFGCVMDAGAM
jgi:MFS family permease